MLEITVTRYLKLSIKILRRKSTLDFSGPKGFKKKKLAKDQKVKFKQKETSEMLLSSPLKRPSLQQEQRRTKSEVIVVSFQRK